MAQFGRHEVWNLYREVILLTHSRTNLYVSISVGSITYLSIHQIALIEKYGVQHRMKTKTEK